MSYNDVWNVPKRAKKAKNRHTMYLREMIWKQYEYGNGKSDSGLCVIGGDGGDACRRLCDVTLYGQEQ